MNTNLRGRQIAKDGKVFLNEEGFIKSLYAGNDPSGKAGYSYEVDFSAEYNRWARIFGFHELYDVDIGRYGIDKWYIPEEYQNIDLLEYIFSKCENAEEKERCIMELELFLENNMTGLLLFLIYIVDVMRNNNIVWGVGRGSSVSSYVLYKIGVHKIDSMKYDLDIYEFFKKHKI